MNDEPYARRLRKSKAFAQASADRGHRSNQQLSPSNVMQLSQMRGICCDVERFDYRLRRRTISPKGPGLHQRSRQVNILRLAVLCETGGFAMVRKTRWSFKDYRRLMELARASTSLEQVVEITGRSPNAIKRAAMRLGISFKSRAKKNQIWGSFASPMRGLF